MNRMKALGCDKKKKCQSSLQRKSQLHGASAGRYSLIGLSDSCVEVAEWGEVARKKSDICRS